MLQNPHKKKKKKNNNNITNNIIFFDKYFYNFASRLQLISIASIFISTSSATTTVTMSSSTKRNSIQKSSSCPILLPQHPPPSTPSSPNHMSNSTTRTRRRPRSYHNNNNNNLYSISHPRQSIVGGDASSSQLSLYLGRLQKYDIPKCSAVLITPTQLLTAAHCVSKEDDLSLLSIYIAGETRNIQRIIIHPRYKFVAGKDRYPFFDLARVYLTTSAPSIAKTMSINTNRSIPIVNSIVRVAGFGVHDPKDVTSGSVLQQTLLLYQVDVPVIAASDCLQSYKSSTIQVNESRNICAGYLGVGQCDSCYGDSGGPMFQYNSENEPVLVGIVSSGLGCAEPEYPGVYVRISKFNNFIPRDEGVNRTTSVVTVSLLPDGRLVTSGNTTSTASHAPSPSPKLQPNSGEEGDINLSSSGISLIVVGVATVVMIIGLIIILFMVRKYRRRKRMQQADDDDQNDDMERNDHG